MEHEILPIFHLNLECLLYGFFYLRHVWLVVLNGGNENDLQCKISTEVLCHSHGGETLIK